MKYAWWGLVIAASTFSQAAPDLKHGESLYKSQCMMCHAMNSNGIGPAHKGLFGRKAGSVANYTYSPALKHSNVVWDEQNLTLWLSDPEKLIPGQKMNFSVPKESDRADIVAFLKASVQN